MKQSNVITLTQGVNPKSNKKVLEISALYNITKPALGIYPVDALKLSDEQIDSEIESIRKNKPLAIGEVGLDLKHGNNIEKQKEILNKFINLAKELDVPIILHSRKAEKETIELLESSKYNKVIMHCFNGNMELVQKIIDNGWYFSIPTIVKYSEHFQKVIQKTPIEQLFCETDSPFLHPDKKPNNEPSNIIEAYKKIAEIKEMKLKEVEKQIEKNYKNLFKR